MSAFLSGRSRDLVIFQWDEEQSPWSMVLGVWLFGDIPLCLARLPDADFLGFVVIASALSWQKDKHLF